MAQSGYFPAAVIGLVMLLGIVVAVWLMNAKPSPPAHNNAAPAATAGSGSSKQEPAKAATEPPKAGRWWNVRIVPNEPVRLRVNLDDPEPGIAESARAIYKADKKSAKGPDDPELRATLREITGMLKKTESRLDQHVAKNPNDRPLMQKVRDLMSEESWYGILGTLSDDKIAAYFEKARGRK